MIEVVEILEGGCYIGECVSGCVDDIVLKNGDVMLKCEGILIWEKYSEEELREIWDEWYECYESGEEGFYMWDESNKMWLSNVSLN